MGSRALLGALLGALLAKLVARAMRKHMDAEGQAAPGRNLFEDLTVRAWARGPELGVPEPVVAEGDENVF